MTLGSEEDMSTRKRWTATSTPEGQDAAVSNWPYFNLLASSNRPIPQFNQPIKERRQRPAHCKGGEFGIELIGKCHLQIVHTLCLHENKHLPTPNSVTI